MSRISVFNSPLLLGFDRFERALDQIQKNGGDGYPPYNVEQLSENRLRITLAVAGFAPEDLQAQIEDSQLVIRGRQRDDAKEDRVFLHRGIAARQFQRNFGPAEGIEVTSATLDNGLLHIELERPLVQPKVRKIAIDAGRSGPEPLTGGPAPKSTGDAAD